MPRKRKRKNGAIIVAFIILLVFAVGVIYAATNGFSARIKTFALKRNGKELIFNDTYGLTFSKEEQFEIVNLTSSEKTFSVKVYAYGTDEGDFTYTYGNEEGYSWQDFAEEKTRDFTACFDFTFEGNVLTFRNDGIKKAMERYDPKMILVDEYPKGDTFILEISCGEDKISLGFSCVEKPTGLTIEPGTIVF